MNIKGRIMARGVLMIDSISKSLATLLLTPFNKTNTEIESVAEIKEVNTKAKRTELNKEPAEILKIKIVGIVKNKMLYKKKTETNLKALKERESKVFNLSLELESNNIIARAIILILARKLVEKLIKDFPSY
jgi:hypothetical protein